MEELVGQVLDGAYRLDALIGEGSMGVVFRATDLSSWDRVAVKILRTPDADQPRHEATLDNLAKRFRREAEVTMRLSNPHTVRIFDYARTADGIHYLVLELLEGIELVDVLTSQTRLNPERVARIGAQICVGLLEAHELGIVHRDLKPENIYLHRGHDGAETVKVLDFGVSYTPGARNGRLTADGSTVGTPTYMSPEQCAGLPTDGRADLYSLGVMLYELLVGEAPFESDSVMELYIAHKLQRPPPLQLHMARPRLDRWRALLEALLAKTPEQRPASAREVADTLWELSEAPGPDEVREADERLMSGF